MADPAPLDRRSPLPLWAQLAEALTRRLDDGEFAGQLPTETRLMAQYGVSRHTVREALRRLRDAGRLEATRGRGTYVTDGLQQRLGALYSLFRQVEAAGMTQTSRVLALDVRTDPARAEHLHLGATVELVHLERLRLVDGEPLAVDRAWLPADLARPLLDADFTRTALYDELARRCGVRPAGGQERLRARLPGSDSRRLLELPADVAVFEIERLSCADGRRVEWRETQIRGDRYSVTVEWTPPVVGRAPGLALEGTLGTGGP